MPSLKFTSRYLNLLKFSSFNFLIYCTLYILTKNSYAEYINQLSLEHLEKLFAQKPQNHTPYQTAIEFQPRIGNNVIIY